jgi:hypothetical protein
MKPTHPLLVIAVLVLGLVAAELAVRGWLESPAHPRVRRDYGWVDAPGTAYVQSREGWSRGRFGSSGLRGPDPGDGPRMLVIGDSYGQALEVMRSDTYAGVVERAVPGTSVVMAGRPGLTPLHHAAYAEALRTAFAPDRVVILVNDGDLGDLEASGLLDLPVEEALSRFRAREDAVVPLRGGLAGTVEGWLRRSGLATFLVRRGELLVGVERRRLGGKFFPAAPAPPAETLPPDPRLLPFYEDLVPLLRGDGEPLFVYVPLLVYTSEGAVPKWPHRRAFYRRLAARTGIRLVDLTRPLVDSFAADGQPLHGFANSRVGTGHLNARGHRILGEVLAAEAERAP